MVSSSIRNLCNLYWIISHLGTLLILLADLWHKCYHFYFTLKANVGSNGDSFFQRTQGWLCWRTQDCLPLHFHPSFPLEQENPFWAFPWHGASEAPQASKARAPQQMFFEIHHWIFRKTPPSSSILWQRDRGRSLLKDLELLLSWLLPFSQVPRHKIPPQLTL